MPLSVVGLPTLTILNGASTSNAIGILDDAFGLTLYGPAAVTSTGIRLEVNPSETSTSGWVTLQSGAADVFIPAAKGTVISPVTFRQMRLAASVAEGADRAFAVTKSILF